MRNNTLGVSTVLLHFTLHLPYTLPYQSVSSLSIAEHYTIVTGKLNVTVIKFFLTYRIFWLQSHLQNTSHKQYQRSRRVPYNDLVYRIRKE